ncbi:formate dehydrogenase subunit gamma [Modicisalibacter xianhensis]|uniref:Formate dehydrogenase subunit gamma n=1 Tax=Modicisalibacter xianhensis TaxID=442341 RepID=A0A1I2ZG09_9GAMM|nr:formate dehydrogenase subunit gamma [Halomonas xianhensis]SFH36783.1 formate dehydrogenase subunit gamma [Halomonas xianhensis]
MSHSNTKKGILRYTWWARTNHWVVAISFVLLVLSGLALFHPFFWSFTGLFGGPIPTRFIHPWIGVVMSLFFLLLAVQFFKESFIKRHDIQWLKQIRDVLSNRDEKLPPVGKNNAGQKLVYWIMVACVPVLLVTGIIIWRPYFADAMPLWLLRFAVMVHAYTAFLAIITLIIHIYSGIWVKGSIRAMVQGRVSKAWAKHHHNLWYEEVMKERNPPSADKDDDSSRQQQSP